MYWGEDSINLAWSENLYDWSPVLDERGELKSMAAPRPKKFDSDLTECGPPAIITNKGIVLLYNGKNATDENADPSLPKGTYSTGQILFDDNDPQKVISRSDTSFLKPSLPHELTGQYQAGTTFAEGLVFFKDKWFLYYGTADSFVGVAISK
jgi:beta-1,2-mannosidase